MSKIFEARLKAIIERAPEDFRRQIQRDVYAILNSGVTSHTELLRLIQDKQASHKMRCAGCWLLTQLGGEKSVSTLLEIAGDQGEEISVRCEAIKALGIFQSKAAIDVLVSIVREDDDESIRNLAIFVLGLIGDERTVGLLINLLNDSSETAGIRGHVAEALASIGSSEAVGPLIAALEDPAVEVRFWAVYALGQLGDKHALPALKHLETTDKTILPGWGTIQEEAAEAIKMIELLQV